MPAALKAPFPYTGGKSSIAPVIWEALGEVGVYVEPFFGSGAVLLARPTPSKVETVNDAHGFLTNFWRAIQQDPEGVARWATWPVSELCLHARHRWLVNQHAFIEAMRSDPDYYDSKIAGWWVWGAGLWIGHGWCDPQASKRRKTPDITGKQQGRGMHQKRPVVAGDRQGNGVHQLWQQTPMIQGDHPRNGMGDLQAWFTALAARLARVRICCGDWHRVCTPVVLDGAGYTGVYLDPPYLHAERDSRLYAVDDDVAQAVAEWCREHGAHPRYRIVLSGYEGNYDLPGWRMHAYTVNGGYGNQGTGRGKANRRRETLWLSPACVAVPQLDLFTQEAP